MRLRILVMFIVLSPLVIKGQNYKLSNQPESFAQEMADLVSTNASGTSDSLGGDFIRFWNGKLSGSQKSDIIKVAQFMASQKVHRGEFQQLVRLLVESSSHPEVGNQIFANLIGAMKGSAESQQTKSLNAFIKSARTVLASRSFFESSYNSLRIESGSFDFGYAEGNETQEAPDPQAENAEDTSEEEAESDDWYSDWAEDSDDGNWDTDWDPEEGSENNQVSAAIIQDEPQPVLSGPIITLKNVNLVFITKNDTTGLNSTSGSLMPLSGVFVGEGGKFDWSMAGLDPNQVYCDFGAYNFQVDKPYLKASNVKMHYQGKISQPVAGIFEFKSGSGKTRDSSYPRFLSFTNDINIQGIGDELLSYQGGFALRGDRVYSASFIGGNTKIELQGKHGWKLRVISRSFQLEDSIISSPRAAVTILIEEDSIHNPAIQFRYQPQEHIVTILKDEGTFKDIAYSSTYFKTDFTADMIKWDMDADSLDVSILSAKNKVPSKFESQEYYSHRKLESLVALYGFNPLLMSVAYARKGKSSEFYADDMAKKLNQNPDKIRGAMRGLMKEGYIEFNSNTGLVKIKRKAYHYVLSKEDKKDFDNLMIPSISPAKSNATLDLKNKEFKIRGIEKFYISELLDVHIKPDKRQIIMLENRDFRFDGFINAGNYQFIGREFRFDYDSFLIALPKIDSITFNIDVPGEDSDRDVKLRITNQLRETAGVLYINKPNNKSSRRIYPEYPIFKADIGAVVYFDGEEILGGVYDKSIYFTIPAFELDSASSSDPSVIKFKGVFTSGGIFPDFEEELTVMPDYSLGFEHKLPYVGLKTYNGTGTVYNKITMDKQGLRSNGKVDFLSTTLHSDDFVYFTDSVTTHGETAVTKPGLFEGASFPDATVENYDMMWFPKTDSMFITSTETPYNLYQGTANLKGTSLITKDGFYADGVLLTRGSESTSSNFTFEEKQLAASDAEFKVNSSDPEKPSLLAKGVTLNFDLENNYADIKSEVDGASVLDFPFTQIRTSISEARWDLDAKQISMKKPDEVDIDHTYFYTTKTEMDSLVFNATEALYDIDKLEMQVYGVPHIKVADARIIPDSNRVFIGENAAIEPFTHAKITLDTLNEFHHLYDGNISIKARHTFSGDAIYQYINANRDTFEIEFENFLLVRDKKLKGNQVFTVATGKIEENDNIYIMPSTLYKGDVTLYANKRILQMDGFIKLDLKNMPDNNSWLAHSSDSEVQDLVINVSEAVSETGKPLTSGFNIDSGTGEIYGTFISEKRSPNDLEVFNAEGLFSYDSAESQYKVIHPNKIKGESLQGNVFSYNDNNTDIQFEGSLNLLSPRTNIQLTASGKGIGNLKDRTVALNSFQAYRFDLPSDAMEIMAQQSQDIISRVGAPAAKTDPTALLRKVADAVGEKTALEYRHRSVAEFVSLADVSTELSRSLVLSNVNMKWSPEYRSWYSVGNLGVSNILDKEINARLEGFLEIRKNEGEDEFHLFLKASPSTYFYFAYLENRLYAYSSVAEFNGEISSNSKLSKAGIGEYAFTTSDMETMLEFIDRFRREYMGIEEPYEINTFAEAEILDEDFTTFEEEKSEEDKADGF